MHLCLFSETYQYYDLPFCRTPDGLEHKPETLGEVRRAPGADIGTAHAAVFQLVQKPWLHSVCIASFTQLAWFTLATLCVSYSCLTVPYHIFMQRNQLHIHIYLTDNIVITAGC